jgi:hypothetical protein
VDEMEFFEFRIGAWQVNDNEAQVILFDSPVGGLRRPITVASNAKQLHADFENVIADIFRNNRDAKQRLIDLGKQLSRIVLPQPISTLLVRSMERIPHEDGIRIRLCLDESLVDIPWDYIYSPEVDISGFLTLNQRVSIVRETPLISQKPKASMQKQRLVFSGAFLNDDSDCWSVMPEYEGLKNALKNVGDLLSIDFIHSSKDNIQNALTMETDIFHYSGHSDNVNGRGYLIKELKDDYESSDRLYSHTLAAMLQKTGTRLAMFSACNSGRWAFIKPLVDEGIPLIIGAFSTITIKAAIAFCEKLYYALAVGLSLDEAVTWGRLRIKELEQSNNEYFEWGNFMVYMPAKDAVIFPRPEDIDLNKRRSTVMESRDQTFTNVIRYDSAIRGIAKKYFEQLISVGTDEEIRKQTSLTVLKDDLRVLDDAKNNDVSYGTVKIKMTANGPVIALKDSDYNFEIGIMPTLIDKMKLIEGCIKTLEDNRMEYRDFSIRVQEKGEITASSEQGDEHDTLKLDLNDVKSLLSLIEEDITADTDLKEIGSKLFSALFPLKIFALFRATCAGVDRCGVRIRLTFDSPELAAIPWELLYDAETNIFLANDTMTALSRYIDLPFRRQDIKPDGLPLKILLIISSPNDLPPLNPDKEENLIKEALKDYIPGQINIDILTKATVREIYQKLGETPYNVIHFIGHGMFEHDQGLIALMDDNGSSKLLEDQDFANLFLGKRGLGLVVLNSCEGAETSSHKIFAGMAPLLVQRGIPAVIAMQYSIRNSTSILFADSFYNALAQGNPVDMAVQSARNFISIQVGRKKRDFATPVLYMRAKDGVIIDLPKQ